MVVSTLTQYAPLLSSQVWFIFRLLHCKSTGKRIPTVDDKSGIDQSRVTVSDGV